MQVVIDIVLPLFMRLVVHGLILLTATTAVIASPARFPPSS
jgi:hypothetical protein